MLDRIGKYELQERLGRGASATVYRAIDTFSDAEIALKVIDAAVFQEPEFGSVLRKQFLNEASLAGKLNHPHIVAILDAVVTEEAGHIAMEYVPGGDLSRYCGAENLLSVEDAIQVSFKCCGALDYAFRQGIVHRDIKPANIMVVKDTDVKIADFGAAYLRKSEATQTVNIGTPAYMSPEQISGQALTHHSDMYCLGVVLYELLTGARPFVAKSITELIQKILAEDPAPPSRVRPSVPPELDHVVLTALNKTPGHRHPSWVEFALELAKIGRLSVYEKTIPDSDKYEALKAVQMLRTLNDAEIWELVQAGRWARLPARSAIIRENDFGQSLFFLAKGDVKVTKQGRLLNIIGAGECFGEMSYIRDGEIPRHASVESMSEVIVAEFQSDALARMMSEVIVAEFQSDALARMSTGCQLHFMRALVRNLAERLALADTRISQASG
ncbi:MAG: protein kinase [Betaproteobacteria bacterium]|nr:protein kinase [Betaproteobacteria bacterium]